MEKIKPNFLGLLPFIFFIALYLGTGVYLETKGVEMAFYQLPASVAMFFAAIFAFLIFNNKTEEKFNAFVEGASQHDIILMCLIFLLSGAFSTLTKGMGGVEAVSNLGLKYINPSLFVAGIFLITCFISFSTGTSVGAIVTLAPIAFDLANKSGINLALMAGAVMGGAMFGDNLSLISDTTIVSSRTQGCKLEDVFKSSAFYAFPAAILTVIVFFFLTGGTNGTVPEIGEISYIKIIPYLSVIILALMGLNVFFVLSSGIVLASLIGIYYGNYAFLDVTKKISEGFLGMGDIIFLSILTGGVSFMVIKNGGFEWLLIKLRALIKGKKSAEFAIASLSSLVDIALANNTIAILICGPVAKDIATNNDIAPRRSASLLDMFSCIFQGIIPYGAQMIILVGFTGDILSPVSVLPFLIYQLFLTLFAVLSIIGLDIRNFFLSLLKGRKNQN